MRAATTTTNQIPPRPDRILITGAEGTIARALSAALSSTGATIWRTSRRQTHGCLQLDLAQAPSAWCLPPETIDVAFLCAAISSQEQCCADPDASALVNTTHTVALAQRLHAAGTFVIFISTNLVFDGNTPHAKADATVNPQTVYGQQKADTEQQLLALGLGLAVVRLSKVIAPNMLLFARWAEQLRAGQTIRPYADMTMAPISLAFAVEVLQRVAAQRYSGIVQASATHDITYAQAAELIAQQFVTPHISPDLIVPQACACSAHHTTLDATALIALGLRAPSPEQALMSLLPV